MIYTTEVFNTNLVATVLTFSGEGSDPVLGIPGVSGSFQSPDITVWWMSNYPNDSLKIIRGVIDGCGDNNIFSSSTNMLDTMPISPIANSLIYATHPLTICCDTVEWSSGEGEGISTIEGNKLTYDLQELGGGPGGINHNMRFDAEPLATFPGETVVGYAYYIENAETNSPHDAVRFATWLSTSGYIGYSRNMSVLSNPKWIASVDSTHIAGLISEGGGGWDSVISDWIPHFGLYHHEPGAYTTEWRFWDDSIGNQYYRASIYFYWITSMP